MPCVSGEGHLDEISDKTCSYVTKDTGLPKVQGIVLKSLGVLIMIEGAVFPNQGL